MERSRKVKPRRSPHAASFVDDIDSLNDVRYELRRARLLLELAAGFATESRDDQESYRMLVDSVEEALEPAFIKISAAAASLYERLSAPTRRQRR